MLATLRNQFLPSLVALLAGALLVLATSCATRQETGALTGAAAGGALGGAVTDGNAAGMLVGAVLGAVVGSEIGAELDRRDRIRAAQVLEYNATNEPTHWVNPDSGYEYTMTPVETYRQPDGTPCREFRMLADVRGRAENVYGTACRQPDGSWRFAG